ncbi:hypothetical protein BV25DRAFT_276815 [Artomyces pyxidatus]|uniref:Uncharacterized protein n=1 Tax=Artomyces pyxidatus TaxID=48021 RepID=A0ACB8T907_9AGAM|nr:hypothetical protein BV25DRAFT_276815 [Artomyces pyxidatus]
MCPQTSRPSDSEVAHLRLVNSSVTSSVARPNGSVPIFRLPPEILASIFELHRDGYVDIAWIGITHVCRRWRDVALGIAQLWSRIDLDYGLDWFEEMIVRSKSAPVAIICRFTSPVSFAIDLIIAHLSQIQTLDLVVGSLTDSELRLLHHGLATCPAPCLQTLSLIDNYRPKLSHPPKPLEIAHQAPRLQSLVLDNVFQISWDQFTFREISRLHVVLPKHEYVGPFPLPSLETILDCLEKLPSLTLLVLGECFPRSHDPTHHLSRTIALPRLDWLDLTGTISGCTQMLEHLGLPPSANLCLNSRLTIKGSESRYHDIFPLLLAHLGGRSNMPLEDVTYKNDVGFKFRASLDLPGAFERRRVTVQFKLEVFWRVARANMTLELMNLACRALHDRRVRKVNFLGTSGVCCDTEDWLNIFGNVEGIEEFYAAYEAADTIWDALSMSVQRKGMADWQMFSTTEAEDRHFFLPDLSSLTLEHGTTDLNVYAPPMVMRARAAAGSPLKTLGIYECSVAPTWIEEVRDIVEEVRWDGRRGDLHS